MLDDVLQKTNYSNATKVAIIRKTGAEVMVEKDGSFKIERIGLMGLCTIFEKAIEVLSLSEEAIKIFCEDKEIGAGSNLFDFFRDWKKDDENEGAGVLFVAVSIIGKVQLSPKNRSRIYSIIYQANPPVSLKTIINVITQNNADAFLTAFLSIGEKQEG